MVTSIQLGTLFNSGGKFVLGGGNTGFDTEALIQSLVDARRIPAVRLEDKVEVNNNKLTALTQLQDILTRFRDSADLLRNPPGVQNASQNIFKYRQATIGSNTAVAGTSYLTATAEPGTNVQNFTITEITSLAAAKKQETNVLAGVSGLDDQAVFAVPAADQFGVGTITVNGVDIFLEDADTLRTVASKFNAVKDQTGISANTLQVAPGQYKLVFTATTTGLSSDFDLGDPGTVTDSSGALAQLTFGDTQPAANATFKLDGTTITRETNQIDDLIDGVTLTLKQVTPDALTSLNLSITPDTDLAKQGIFNFIDSYNELRIFLSQQTSRQEDGSEFEGATLVGNSAVRSIGDNINLELAKAVEGLGSSVLSRLSDLGITFSDFPGDSKTPFTRNILTVDEDQLESVLAANYEEVQKVFEFSFTSSNTNLQVFKRTNALSISSFSLNIDQTNGIYQATFDVDGSPKTIDLDATTLTGGTGGVFLQGQAGTELEGLELIFTSTVDEVVTVDLSQGIGDRIYNALNDYLAQDTGLVDTEITSATDANTRYENEIARIDAQIETYRESLLARFSALEAALNSVNTILQALDAQQNAINNG